MANLLAIEALPQFLNVRQVADLLNVSPKAVYNMLGRGKLPGVFKIDGRIRVHRDELVAWLHNSRMPTV